MAKKKSTNKPIGPQEYNGYKVGDKVMCHRYPDEKLGYGAITQIHLNQKSGEPCFTFGCEMCGQHRLAMFDKIIDNPTPQQQAAAGKAKRSLYPSRKK